MKIPQPLGRWIGRGALALAGAALLAARLPAQNGPSLAPGQRAPLMGSADGPDIHDLHSIVPLTYWEKHGTQVILGSVAGVILLALIIWLLLRKKPAPPLTPYERAQKELAYARGLQDSGPDKVFAIAASDAVRHYLENAYKMPAPERTTEEFLQEASRHTWLQGELTVLLKRFLEFCDLAKFAGQQFGAEEREQLLAAAREFIDTAEKNRRVPANAALPAKAAPTAAPPPPAKTPATPTLSTP